MAHGSLSRTGAGVPLTATFKPGRFGRLFPHLAPLQAEDAALVALGLAMREANPDDVAGDNPSIPAGYTYLGQFVDHDITFDPTTLTEVAIDPLALRNFRTPRLDLDCLYGLGPAAQPYLYEPSDRNRLALGAVQDVGTGHGNMPNDVPRFNGFDPLIGDPRNDENLIVSQLNVAFLKFHNAVVDHVMALGVPADQVFNEARRITTWHYQWIVLHDFVQRLVDPAVFSDVLTNGRKLFHFIDEPFMPVEFSVAAYRLGHSMVRENYRYNRIFDPASLGLIFLFTSGGGNVPVPDNWIIDWRRFFDLPIGGPGVNPSRKLDASAAPTLIDQPFLAPGLPVLNLRRGKKMLLPSGQAVAAEIGAVPLSPADLATGTEGAAALANGLHVKSPLWYYILKEAEHQGLGQRLGSVGSRIVMETFVGLLKGDSESFLSKAPEWKPELTSAVPGHFTMADMITFAFGSDPLIAGS